MFVIKYITGKELLWQKVFIKCNNSLIKSQKIISDCSLLKIRRYNSEGILLLKIKRYNFVVLMVYLLHKTKYLLNDVVNVSNCAKHYLIHLQHQHNIVFSITVYPMWRICNENTGKLPFFSENDFLWVGGCFRLFLDLKFFTPNVKVWYHHIKCSFHQML